MLLGERAIASQAYLDTETVVLKAVTAPSLVLYLHTAFVCTSSRRVNCKVRTSASARVTTLWHVPCSSCRPRAALVLVAKQHLICLP